MGSKKVRCDSERARIWSAGDFLLHLIPEEWGNSYLPARPKFSLDFPPREAGHWPDRTVLLVPREGDPESFWGGRQD